MSPNKTECRVLCVCQNNLTTGNCYANILKEMAS